MVDHLGRDRGPVVGGDAVPSGLEGGPQRRRDGGQGGVEIGRRHAEVVEAHAVEALGAGPQGGVAAGPDLVEDGPHGGHRLVPRHLRPGQHAGQVPPDAAQVEPLEHERASVPAGFG